jgi:hypothetical protein
MVDKEKIFKNIYLFEEFISNEVAKRWTKEYPEYFVICNATGQEYDDAIRGPYSWYMKFRNGRIDYHKNYNLTDSAKHKLNIDVEETRKAFYKDMLDASDIRIWCIENYMI